MARADDHGPRLERAELALDGLSVGDGFGERFFVNPEIVERLIAQRALPRPPWRTTDDTEMAVAVTDVIAQRGGIDSDLLARAFAQRYARDPERGYGGGAHQILQALVAGVPWREAAASAFDGQGSLGNGGAMRVAPVGAYFADDYDAVVEHARASAVVTHAHPDGQAGAIAVALAAAYAWLWGHGPASTRSESLLDVVIRRTPRSDTRRVLERARALPASAGVETAMWTLGTGNKVTAADTVPFALWCASRHLGDYEEALWTTVSGLGDRDTTCAIVGGIVALSAGRTSIPSAWLAAREPLKRGLG